MSMIIKSIGTASPAHRISQVDAARLAMPHSCETQAHERLFQTLYRRAGIETRHSVVLVGSDGDLENRQSFYGDQCPTTSERMQKFSEEAGPLAVSAARKALDGAHVDPDRITHLVTVSCSGFYMPGFDIALLKQLPLSADVARTHVGFMGCHGALNGLRVAHGFIGADPESCVLLCAVELCSLHHQYGWDADKVVANSLFADGAAALVGVAGDVPCQDGFRVVASGSTVIADSEDAMSWRIGDQGFTMTLSSCVPDLICRHLRPWLESWLFRHGLTIDSVGSWAVHPGGPRILSAFGEATGIDREALSVSYRVLAEYGNMSSPTILFILDRLRQTRVPRPCVVLAFGPGLTVEAVILK